MNETWEQTKARFRKLGVKLKTEETIEMPRPRYDTAELEKIISEPLYEVRKITLPPDRKLEHGKIVLYGVTAKEADWWIENKLKAKVYENDETNTKTLVFYEKFPIDGTPEERNVYSNPKRFCTVDFPEFNYPRRIN